MFSDTILMTIKLISSHKKVIWFSSTNPFVFNRVVSRYKIEFNRTFLTRILSLNFLLNVFSLFFRNVTLEHQFIIHGTESIKLINICEKNKTQLSFTENLCNKKLMDNFTQRILSSIILGLIDFISARMFFSTVKFGYGNFSNY